MNESVCSYGESRDELLVSFLYNELAVDERASFGRHLAACLPCRAELEALRDVRMDLRQWSPPVQDFRVPLEPVRPPVRSRFAAFIPDIPTWAQAAAAVLFLGAGAGMANLEITYGKDGLLVQTGWRHQAAAPAAPGNDALATAPAGGEAWRSELTALEQRLRSEMAVRQAAAPGLSEAEDALIRRVRGLVRDSEQRQQREIALRVAEMARQVEGQRQADLQRIDRNLGLIERSTGLEVMRTQQQFKNLVQRVSQQQP